jgi:preprotein translocase subunit SecA
MSAIVKIFDGERDANRLARLALQAQRRSEETSYDVRRRLIERDDVTDRQRKTIYKMRQETLSSQWTKERVQSLIADFVRDIVDTDERELRTRCMNDFGVGIPKLDPIMSVEEVAETITKAFAESYDSRESALGVEFSHRLGRAAMLEALETAWADYLSFQSEFDKSLSLRSYVKGGTLTDYRLEATELFEELLASVKREVLRDIFTYPLPGMKTDSIHGAETPKSSRINLRDGVGKLYLV